MLSLRIAHPFFIARNKWTVTRLQRLERSDWRAGLSFTWRATIIRCGKG